MVGTEDAPGRRLTPRNGALAGSRPGTGASAGELVAKRFPSSVRSSLRQVAGDS
jgi:hypothetical protein